MLNVSIVSQYKWSVHLQDKFSLAVAKLFLKYFSYIITLPNQEELNPLFSMAQEETMRLALVHSDFIQKLVMLFNIGQHLVYGRQSHFSR